MKRAVVIFLMALVLAAGTVNAQDVLRSGNVLSIEKGESDIYIKAVDSEGKEFWVATTTCVIAEDASIEVLSGQHYEKVRSELLGGEIEDFYAARLIRINGVEVKGFTAHGLPEGCVDVRK